jgi:hypothetical protein
MKFRIHYVADGMGMSFDVTGVTVEECIAKKDKFFKIRGQHLDQPDSVQNTAWSEEIKND